MSDKSTDSLELKTFSGFEIKDPDKGEVEAIVATLNVVDKDGDVILPGAIPEGARIHLSAYGHDILKEDAPPAGVGTISVKGDKAHFTGRYFMSTTRGRDAFHTVKELGADTEWSFGFLKAKTKTSPMTNEWQAKGARRLIAGLSPAEASPVFIGAGYGTGTLFTKSKEDEDAALETARVEAEAKTKLEAEAKAKEEAEVKAKEDAEIQAKAANATGLIEFERFQRTMKKLGHAA